MESEFELTPDQVKEIIVDELNTLMSKLPEKTRKLLIIQLEEWIKQNKSD